MVVVVVGVDPLPLFLIWHWLHPQCVPFSETSTKLWRVTSPQGSETLLYDYENELSMNTMENGFHLYLGIVASRNVPRASYSHFSLSANLSSVPLS